MRVKWREEISLGVYKEALRAIPFKDHTSDIKVEPGLLIRLELAKKIKRRDGLEFAVNIWEASAWVLAPSPFFIICPLWAQEDGIIDPLLSSLPLPGTARSSHSLEEGSNKRRELCWVFALHKQKHTQSPFQLLPLSPLSFLPMFRVVT